MERVNKVHLFCLVICVLISIGTVQVQGSPVNEPQKETETGQVPITKAKTGKNLILQSAAFTYPYSIYPYSAYAYLYPSYVAQPVVPDMSPLVPVVNANLPFPEHIATTGPCRNSKGIPGECVDFKKCYPYFKLPTVENYDTWIIGMFDTCSYYTEQGKQLFGVCCTAIPVPISSTNPTEISEDTEVVEKFNETSETVEAITENRENATEAANMTYAAVDRDGAKFDNFGNWPPPLPTHAPGNTIPPLPTHPPSHGIPGGIQMFPGGIPVLLPTTSRPAGFPPAFAPTAKPPFMKPNKPSTTKVPTTTPSSLGIAACGAKNGPDQNRIVGGHNAEVNEWPWIAALFNSGRQFCGGSLIDDIHILSAAHCVAHMSSWDVARLTVRLGDHNIKTNTETRHIEKKVKRVVRHKGFDSRTLYNDIALLTLDSPVEFSSKIRPVCLPTPGGRDWSGSTGTVIGWGSLRESGPQPSVLQEVKIPIWSNQQCKLKYGAAAPGGIVDHMICAGEANKDSCSGDSGGPLMVNHGKWTQVGVVSWGIGCGKGQYPGVYTRIEKFLPWIQKNLKR